jgi:hypothetical protein
MILKRTSNYFQGEERVGQLLLVPSFFLSFFLLFRCLTTLPVTRLCNVGDGVINTYLALGGMTTGAGNLTQYQFVRHKSHIT